MDYHEPCVRSGAREKRMARFEKASPRLLRGAPIDNRKAHDGLPVQPLLNPPWRALQWTNRSVIGSVQLVLDIIAIARTITPCGHAI